MLIGTGSTDKFLSESEIRELTARAFSQAELDGKRVIIIIPDGTRTAPIPLMFRLFHELLGQRVAVLLTIKLIMIRVVSVGYSNV